MVRITESGVVSEPLPDCDARDFSKLSKASQARVKRFWETVALPTFAGDKARRQALDADLSRDAVSHYSGTDRDFFKKRRIADQHRIDEYRATSIAEYSRYEATRDAFVATLPPGDRMEAQFAMGVMVPPPIVPGAVRRCVQR